jgi:hypothetical protein
MGTNDKVEVALSSTRFLGLAWIVYGIARILSALWLMAFAATAKVMFGSLLSRVANPFAMMDHFHIVYFAIVVISFVCGVLGILAGLALLTGSSAGRVLALWAAFLSLPEMPLGLMLGVYTIVRFLARWGTNYGTAEGAAV